LLRLSGPDALQLTRDVVKKNRRWTPRRLVLSRICAADGTLIDEALIAWMPGPKSYTGEDVVEISCHGNPVIIEMILDRLIQAGARPARAGEFTRRAVENGRSSLLQAESLAGLISAGTPQGVALAHQGMGGAVDDHANDLREHLLDLTAELEARLDHPGDDLGYESDTAVVEGLSRVSQQARALAQTWRQGRRCLRGASVALVGPVNAGKSSLFNHLIGKQRALVSATPGTTRDVIEQSVLLDGLDVRFLDTAGERSQTDDPIEAAGIALGRTLTEDVDLTLVLVPLHMKSDPSIADILMRTSDRHRLIVGTWLDSGESGDEMDLCISNRTGAGIDALQKKIRSMLGANELGEVSTMLLSQRQHDLFRAVGEHADHAAVALQGMLGPAVAAEECIQALERLSELVGSRVREDVLDRLFQRFCIGK